MCAGLDLTGSVGHLGFDGDSCSCGDALGNGQWWTAWSAPPRVRKLKPLGRVGSHVYFTGQIGALPGTTMLIAGDMADQSRQTVQNIKAMGDEMDDSEKICGGVSSSRWGCACTSRRSFLAGATGIALGACLPAISQTQIASITAGAVDVHHHIYPPKYTQENLKRIVADIGVAPAAFYTNWSPQSAIEKMDAAGVATAVNSMSSPGVWFSDGEAGRIRARECNEYGATLIRDFPGRFGMFAAIPLPDVEGSLRELSYALDVLNLDGIGVLTSYESKLLGDPIFLPVLEELNRRRAVVFVHPTMSCCNIPVAGVAPPIIDFPIDTTRTIASLMFTGTFVRFRDIRFIFSHGGGALLPLANRFDLVVARMKPEDRARIAPESAQRELQRQFYDLASIGLNQAGLAGLRKMMPSTQLLYGSDEPFTSTVQTMKALAADALPAEDWQRIQRDNALQLFRRLRA